jgi:undecaprenyl-diphosphatase
MGVWSRVAARTDIIVQAVLDWDRRTVQTIAQLPGLRRFAKVFLTATYLGDGYLWGSLGLGLILFGNTLDRFRVLIAVGITIVNMFVFRFIKLMVGRIRPTDAMPRLRSRVIDGYSFPSGHATTSFGLAWVVSASYPHLPVQIAVYSAAGVIAFSRVYVREHYPLDVLFGAALGSLIASLLFPLFCWLFL